MTKDSGGDPIWTTSLSVNLLAQGQHSITVKAVSGATNPLILSVCSFTTTTGLPYGNEPSTPETTGILIIGGALVVGAVVLFIVSSRRKQVQYF
jgi:hypothetical protein